jgi:ERCC4-type nuclease
MFIKIDAREQELIRICKYYIEISPSFKGIEVQTASLPIGDIIIADEKGQERLIVERKSLVDLSASIKDGRYEEQSYRLHGSDFHPHNIIYLIEGDVAKINTFRGHIDKTTLYSAMFSLNYYKGFSVMRSFSIDESGLMMCYLANKLRKSGDKEPYYKLEKKVLSTKTDDTTVVDENSTVDKSTVDKSTVDKSTVDKSTEENYCHVVKKVKKDNITPDNIGEIMLSQIPGISSVSAIAIMKEFKTIGGLILRVKEEGEACLTKISYVNEKQQTRKINKTVIANILKFLNPEK